MNIRVCKRVCVDCGVDFISSTAIISNRHGPLPTSSSIDRIIPKLGCVKENIAVISHQANVIKNNCTDYKIFQRLADWMQKYDKEYYNQWTTPMFEPIEMQAS